MSDYAKRGKRHPVKETKPHKKQQIQQVASEPRLSAWNSVGKTISESQTQGDANALNPDHVMDLQRTIGNQAVIQLLTVQRDQPATATATDVLTADEVASAKHFYEVSNLHQYPPKIVKKLREKLGLSAGSSVDEEMIQTVAKKQKDNGTLVVDGKAGKNTILALFPNGLSDYENTKVKASTEKPLNAAQVGKALDYYARRSDMYTPRIIGKIQEQVGASVTGKMDAETVQAVARFQKADGTLAVDGMAGPRTLPAAFPIGLAKSDEQKQYISDVGSFVTREWWDSFNGKKDPAKARANAILGMVNKRLDVAGVKKAGIVFKDIAALGEFDPEIWSMVFGLKAFGEEFDNVNIPRMLATFYHEARHAQQIFACARLLFGKGKTEKQVADQHVWFKEIIPEAKAAPIIPGTVEAVVVQGWYDSLFGKDRHRRREAFKEPNKHPELLREVKEASRILWIAKRDARVDPTPENKKRVEEAQKVIDALKPEYRRITAAYFNLPEEADAHRVDDPIEEQLEEAYFAKYEKKNEKARTE